MKLSLLSFKAWLEAQDRFHIYKHPDADTFYLAVRDAAGQETTVADTITAGQLTALWDTLTAIPALALHVQQYVQQHAQPQQ